MLRPLLEARRPLLSRCAFAAAVWMVSTALRSATRTMVTEASTGTRWAPVVTVGTVADCRRLAAIEVRVTASRLSRLVPISATHTEQVMPAATDQDAATPLTFRSAQAAPGDHVADMFVEDRGGSGVEPRCAEALRALVMPAATDPGTSAGQALFIKTTEYVVTPVEPLADAGVPAPPASSTQQADCDEEIAQQLTSHVDAHPAAQPQEGARDDR